MPSIGRHALIAAFAFLVMTGAACRAHAANALNSLDLEPKSTLLVLLDKEGKLTVRPNRRLFEAAGFHVEILKACGEGNEADCVRRRLGELHRAHGELDLLLMTSARHSRTVHSLYAQAELDDLVSAVVMFRAEYSAAAGPSEAVRDAPPLLVIARGGDAPAVVAASRRFSDHMRRIGVWSWFFLLPDRMSRNFRPGDHDTVIKVICQFIGYRFPAAGKDDDYFYRFLTEYSRWQAPPLNHDGFNAHPRFIASYPVSDHFMETMRFRFRDEPYRLKQWKFQTFRGFDVLAWRDSKAATRGARYMVLRNLSGNFFPLDLDVYGQYGPLIVVGIDHESNLFRVHPFLYQGRTKYSWIKDGPPDISVRPLGAFLHFRKPLPKPLKPIIGLTSNLKLDSLAFERKDPLAALEGISPGLRGVFTAMNGGCVYCHKVRNTGGRMHHLAAATLRPQPGFGLPLREYPREVMHRFLYDQKRVAAMFGVAPNFVPEEQARQLSAFLAGGR